VVAIRGAVVRTVGSDPSVSLFATRRTLSEGCLPRRADHVCGTAEEEGVRQVIERFVLAAEPPAT
jgi:hypothetical protein